MITPSETRLIRAIAERAVAFYERIDVKAKPEFISMELMLVHDEIVPLRLQEMLDGSDFDFMHDVAGIHRHLKIGKPSKLVDCFLPRFARVT
jgi:hypothetical protein